MELKHELITLSNGKPIKDKKRFETINPSTGKVITNIAEASSKDVDLAVEAAIEAFIIFGDLLMKRT
ncbi:hypothetical protein C2G38_2221650 [Gigaspora rosea]|uniref:Aldehyde dehydrogenase domain-containing protein n=1 Tax=Gigaspora rosea TaxID=44941 RepID=A0A397U362_9GLOM|nr:hypothetical protein C2G38_2221650 [Gigaspora rosea]